MVVELHHEEMIEIAGAAWYAQAAAAVLATAGGARIGVAAAGAFGVAATYVGWAAGAAFFASPVGLGVCVLLGVGSALYLTFGR